MYWHYYAPTKSWIEIDVDGTPVYAKDWQMIGRRFLPRHATGLAPTEIPTLPADMTKVGMELNLQVTLRVTKTYTHHFTPDGLHLSSDDVENAWSSVRRDPGTIQAVVTKVTGFDKKYLCSSCEQQGTDEEPHPMHLCKCGAIGSFSDWTPPSTVYKVGDIVKMC